MKSSQQWCIKGKMECHEEFKQKHKDNLCKYWHFNELQDELTSPENSGRYFLHHDDKI